MSERNKHDQELVDAGFAPDAEEVELPGEPVASPQATEIHELINTKSGLIGVRAVQPAAGTTPYDRDKVRDLERQIELNGDNRFVGYKLSSDEGTTPQAERPRCKHGNTMCLLCFAETRNKG